MTAQAPDQGADAGELLLVDKPAGWTSFDVVNKLRYAHGGLKMGHAGTLDPLATGLLIICTGRKRKQIDQFMGLDKEYVATLRLGIRTPSFDMETPVIEERPMEGITEERIRDVIAGIHRHAAAAPADVVGGQEGRQEAVRSCTDRGSKWNGRPARSASNRSARTGSLIPDVTMTVTCSKGTYIRALVNDIGERLGCGATMTALRRTKIGPYRIEDARSVEQLVERARELRAGMNVLRSFDTLHREKNSVVTVGTFDGIHLAHREIIREVVHRARMREGRSVVVTFDPHPKEVVTSARGPVQLLSTLDERIALLDALHGGSVPGDPVHLRVLQDERRGFLHEHHRCARRCERGRCRV